MDWQRANANFFNAIQVERNVMFLILSLIILVAAFNILSGQYMLVKGKGRDIAILRTMGATRGMILRIFFLSGASIGVFGTLLGFILGIAFADNIEHYGDPDFVESPVNGLASPAFAAERRKAISLERALPRPIAPGDPWPFEDRALAPEVLPGDSALARRGGTSQVAVPLTARRAPT